MPNPKVSVIMNCLDAERYLPASLSSIQAQSFQDLEIIFWDNGSVDNSASIAQDYGPQLRYFKSKETIPLGAARNLAIAQARGDYIAFLDCDDIWRPTKLAKQVALFAANPKVGLVCTDTEICQGQNALYRLFSRSEPGRGNVFAPLIQRQWISMSSAMLRKTALEDMAAKTAAVLPEIPGAWFDERLNVCEEADVFYRIAHDWELDFVDEALTVWRVHASNTTFRKFGQFADETLAILAKHRRLYPGYDAAYPELVEQMESRAAFQKAIALWREGLNSDARKAILPHREKSLKYRLFWWLTFLPGAAFDPVARLYFSLPAWLRG